MSVKFHLKMVPGSAYKINSSRVAGLLTVVHISLPNVILVCPLRTHLLHPSLFWQLCRQRFSSQRSKGCLRAKTRYCRYHTRDCSWTGAQEPPEAVAAGGCNPLKAVQLSAKRQYGGTVHLCWESLDVGVPFCSLLGLLPVKQSSGPQPSSKVLTAKTPLK